MHLVNKNLESKDKTANYNNDANYNVNFKSPLVNKGKNSKNKASIQVQPATSTY